MRTLRTIKKSKSQFLEKSIKKYLLNGNCPEGIEAKQLFYGLIVIRGGDVRVPDEQKKQRKKRKEEESFLLKKYHFRLPG